MVSKAGPVMTVRSYPVQDPVVLKHKISDVLTTLDNANDTPADTEWSVSSITPEDKAKMVAFFKQKAPVAKVATKEVDFFA